MEQATPDVRDFARLLLALEAPQNEHGQGEAFAAIRVFARLRLHLSKLIGIVSFQVVLSRTLVLAKAEVPGLQAVHVQADATLEGFQKMAQHYPAEAVMEGSVALVAQFLGLLATFIGATLTLRLIQEIWSEAQWDDRHVCAQTIAMSEQGK